MDKNGVYIVSYWTGDDISDPLHTIAVNHIGDIYRTYNTKYGKMYDYKGNVYYSYTNTLPNECVENNFVFGYYLSGGNRKE